jgi:hypothetical protein
VPERRKMPVRVSSERMAAAALRVLNSASVIRLRSFRLLIRQPWKDGEHCNRAVQVDCPPGFTAASIQNGVTAWRATDGTGHYVSADRSRLDSLGTVSATILDCLQRRA